MYYLSSGSGAAPPSGGPARWVVESEGKPPEPASITCDGVKAECSCVHAVPCAACHSDPIAALVKDRDDARRELAETKARLAALESASVELVNALPRCAGKWVGGSGGHAIIEPCSRMATVFNTDCIYGQTCDEHRALIESGADDAIWAELAADAAAKVLALVPVSSSND